MAKRSLFLFVGRTGELKNAIYLPKPDFTSTSCVYIKEDVEFPTILNFVYWKNSSRTTRIRIWRKEYQSKNNIKLHYVQSCTQLKCYENQIMMMMMIMVLPTRRSTVSRRAAGVRVWIASAQPEPWSSRPGGPRRGTLAYRQR